MKKIIIALMLVASVTGTCFAQTENGFANTDKTFQLSQQYFKRIFIIDLGKGNKLQINLYDMDDLAMFNNMDSVLHVFLKDIEPLKDSLSDELTSKRIDYLTDSMGRKKILLQQFKQKGSSYLVNHGDVAALKLEQDTVNFVGAVQYTAKYTLRKAFKDTRYYKLSFFINNINDLSNYTDGKLSEKIINLQKNVNSQWTNDFNGMYNNVDKTVKARQPRGYIGMGDFLEMHISVNAQNYKNYFVPSVSLGASLVLSKNDFKRDIGLFWEPNFFFAKNTQGNLQVYRNDLLTLTFGQGPVKDHDPRKESTFLTVFSISYLITRKGDFMDKQTIRFGAGEISLFEGKTKIEPAIYFNNLFKNVTPGIRWIQSF
jgi:hypothetical protein